MDGVNTGFSAYKASVFGGVPKIDFLMMLNQACKGIRFFNEKLRLKINKKVVGNI